MIKVVGLKYPNPKLNIVAISKEDPAEDYPRDQLFVVKILVKKIFVDAIVDTSR